MSEEKKKSFEAALAELEKIVAEMESGQLPLDDMLVRFERGRALADVCANELNAIRQRIEKVTAADPSKTEPLEV